MLSSIIPIARDDNFNYVEKCVCWLYGIEKNGVRGIDDAKHSHFVKTNRALEPFSPAHDVRVTCHKLKYDLPQTMRQLF